MCVGTPLYLFSFMLMTMSMDTYKYEYIVYMKPSFSEICVVLDLQTFLSG